MLSPLVIAIAAFVGVTALVGGVALNTGVVRYVEEDLGIKLADLQAEPQIYGALGAALMAKEKHAELNH